MAHRYRLSKSTFMRGLQCPKSLYLYKHYYDLQDEISAAREAIFAQGHEVGELAQQLFPGGVDLSPKRVKEAKPEFAQAIERTAEEIAKGTPVIYEAALVHEGVLAAMDILVRDGDRWKAYEVKSGARVKDAYATDAALQYWVLTGAGLDIADISIVHIDSSYVRDGDIDVHRLFAIESVLERAQERHDEIGSAVARCHEVIDARDVPEIGIGPHCSDPYECSFHGHCWQHVPEVSVFDLSGMGRKGWQLHEQGILRIEDIPDDFELNGKQRIEVQAAVSAEPHIEPEAVREFVSGLEYPLYFLDFETLITAVPLFDGSSPYKPVPCQYSLHRRAEPGGDLQHSAFLGDGRSDPRPALLEQLIRDVGPDGDILMYTSYERTQLNNLIEAVPQRAAEIQALIDRLVDLARPFATHSYYTAAMSGSYSIKYVLPALVPDLAYEGMDIADGMAASNAYASLHFESDPARIAEIRQQLLDYCGFDTLAMVRLLEVLEAV